MPTITLSWTDLALFGLTAGLVGSIVLIGRSTSVPSIQGVASDEKKTTASKKKKSRSKKGASPAAPPPASSSNNHSNKPIQPPASPPETVPPKVISEAPVSQLHFFAATKKAEEPVDPKFHQDFPPLSTSSKDQTKKHEPSRQRPFAERHMQPVRKTKVDDMIDHDVEKPLKISRVMTIVNSKPQVPSSPTSDPEEGWEKVMDSKPKRSRNTDNKMASGSATSRLAPSTTAQPSEQKLSKRQRQSAKKKEAAKTDKATDEAERLRQLASHKRDQERLRIIAKASLSIPNKSGSNKTAGGMKSSIGKDGRLIWE